MSDEEIILKEYVENKKSKLSIMREYGFSSYKIKNVLRKNGVKTRDNSFNSRKYNMDEDFFEVIDTEDKAYWLGFIMADGWITSGKVLGIKLHPKDKSHLQKFLISTKSNYPIHHGITTHGYSKGGEYVLLNITNKKLYQDLHDKGVLIKKSKKLEFPNKIPNDLINHFIRGYFDGDGSVFKRNDGYFGVSILGTENFLKKILELSDIHKKIYKYKKKEIHYISLCCRGVKKFLDFIYKDSNIYLERKKEIYTLTF
jgi:hypothetical protein